MKQVAARIIDNRNIKNNYWHCIIDAPTIVKQTLPGQFINLKVSEHADPLLRRPFSIHNISAKRIEILYEVLGKGTQILASKKCGEYLDLIGPLGNGFNCKSGRKPVIVGGGMGIAPLFFLAKRIMEAKGQGSKVKGVVFLGARSKNQIICEKDFKKIGWEVKIATDDGSIGYKGRVTDLLKVNLDATMIYACGPKPMLKVITGIAQSQGIPAQLSLEEHMSCGIGACLGCVVKTTDGFKRVCKEGPVFNAAQLIW